MTLAASSTRTRRTALVGLLLGACLQGAALAADAWDRVVPGTIVLFRHALAPGGGDPPNHTIGDCSTQRNLSEEGRTQARRMGHEFKQRRISVGAVWTSQWCRTRDTADLAFPGQRVDQPVFNSFFNEAALAGDRTQAAQHLLASWRGPGVLVVVTHQVNITELTGIVTGSGEGVVVKPSANGLQVLGRVAP